MLLKSSGDCLCQFVFREANMVAHVLAKHGLSVTSNLFWLEDFPPAASSFVAADKPNIAIPHIG